MNKPNHLHVVEVKEKSSRRIAESATQMRVVDQVKTAFAPKNRLATSLGFLLGGIVPIATYMMAHQVFPAAQTWYKLTATLVAVGGGLIFSAKTVYDWGTAAFRLPLKAFGLMMLLELVMITADPPLSLVMLTYLVVLNGIATGCNLSLQDNIKSKN